MSFLQLLYPQDTMAPVLAMVQKGVSLIRERLISLCKEIDDDIDVNALWDPTIVFCIRKEDIVMKIAGAMHETGYRRYSVWYKKVSKAVKRLAGIAQWGPSTKTRKLIVSHDLAAGKRRSRKGA